MTQGRTCALSPVLPRPRRAKSWASNDHPTKSAILRGPRMSAVVIRGREVADQVLDEVAARVRGRLEAGLRRPHLAVVLVGHNPASETYIVGKPVALMLLQRHATVTVCHSQTVGLEEFARQADVLVAALGRPHFVKPDMVRPGAVVIDVGVTPMEGKVRGDVDPGVAEVAGWVTPVPGGVGLMTRAMLMANTLAAEE